MSQAQPYDQRFYDSQADLSAASARVVVPFLVEALKPRSVIDIGCGAGAWCAEFALRGVEAVHGVDGPWVDRPTWRLRPEQFTAFDFGRAALPFRPKTPRDRYDLAITLEFLEHVEAARAEALVDLLTGLTDVVIAGAAIPGQGGMHHVNEQWPRHWCGLFAERGFRPYDYIRPALWDAPGVEPWYLQNTIAYFRGRPPPALRVKTEALVLARLGAPPSLVHPELFGRAIDPARKPIRAHLTGLYPGARCRERIRS